MSFTRKLILSGDFSPVSQSKEIHFRVNDKVGEVSGLLLRPKDANALLVLAHSAGASMRHKFMEAIAEKLALVGVTTLRYQFPYMEKGIKRPDSELVLTETARAAVSAAGKYADDLAPFAAGKSMGGRVTSLAARSEERRGGE